MFVGKNPCQSRGFVRARVILRDIQMTGLHERPTPELSRWMVNVGIVLVIAEFYFTFLPARPAPRTGQLETGAKIALARASAVNAGDTYERQVCGELEQRLVDCSSPFTDTHWSDLNVRSRRHSCP